jgi:hypothetical protein
MVFVIFTMVFVSGTPGLETKAMVSKLEKIFW